MTAAQVPLVFEQGATFMQSFQWCLDSETTPGTPGDPIDLSDCEMRMQVRKNQQSPVLLEALSTGPSPFILFPGTPGVFTIRIPASATSQLNTRSAKYDLEIVVPGEDVYRAMEGPVAVRPNITQLDGEPAVK